MLYFMLDVVAGEFGGFDHSGLVIFILAEFMFRVGRVGLIERP
jgi:hypothetical protein